jgi:hypothetical protein
MYNKTINGENVHTRIITSSSSVKIGNKSLSFKGTTLIRQEFKNLIKTGIRLSTTLFGL